MWVVKLGGSLAQSPRLQGWLKALAEHGAGRAVIVPGGGPFADMVRAEQARARFRDNAAHAMAILAMEQFGFMLAGLNPDLCVAAAEPELRGALANGRVPVWLAYPMIIRDSTLPQDWSVTADSLALWLAIRLKAEALLLVKSATLPDGPADMGSLSTSGALDSHFPVLARQFGGELRWLNSGDSQLLKEGLAQGKLPGQPVLSGEKK